MAGKAPAVPCSLHADQLVLAEPGRALVRALDRETAAPRRPQVGQAAREGHPGLGGHMEREPQPFIWTKSAEEILESLGRLLQRIKDPGHQARARLRSELPPVGAASAPACRDR